ncbi:MAG: zinc-dependent metalloprotease [Bacteroidaceae bacterium]|nr:zinc-dependent metalloprotease [Bacteroidaceae bacterium]MBO4560819.1 zinc-dependent metalloprotease [Bacteroidaceae bacterium]
MRQILLLIGFLFACPIFLHGQNNLLICSKLVTEREEKTNEILSKSDTYNSVEFVDVNLDKILEYEEFILQIDGKEIKIIKERIDARGINNYVFIGGNNEGCRVLLSVLDDDIQGVVETAEEVFTLETVDRQQYALITVDYSKLREACEYLQEEYHSSYDGLDEQKIVSEMENVEAKTVSPILRSASAYECKIRVLVLYTPSADSSVSNIKNTILTAVALTNQSFANSQIDYQIELVHIGLTNYTESGGTALDLSRFRNIGDGYMDEVSSLRNKYSADICVLLTYDKNACGLARGVGVQAANAYCLVSTYSTCATSNYSFAHEIGHLLGCRHDTYVDNNTTPYAYGHGYVHPSNTWRTIMAYVNACGSCPRLLYWSNPNITYNGAPMGTSTTNDNTRVWNERSDIVIAFKQPDNDITIINSDISNAQYADVIAKQNIATSGMVNTVSGTTFNMRAGNSITLQPDFSVQVGAEFSAQIDNVYDCEECALSAPIVIIQNLSEDVDDLEDNRKESAITYYVLSDFSSENINIAYSLDTEAIISIELVDLFGQEKKIILPKQKQQEGSYKLLVSVSDLSEGTYFLVISSTDFSETVKKIIVNKKI